MYLTESKLNKKFKEFLEQKEIKFIQEYKYKNTEIKNLCKNENFSKMVLKVNRYFDFFLSEYNLLVELNPLFTHCLEKHDIEQNLKREIAKQDGKKIIFIWDSVPSTKIIKEDEIVLFEKYGTKDFYNQIEMIINHIKINKGIKNINLLQDIFNYSKFYYPSSLKEIQQKHIEIFKNKELSLEEAKEKWPEWYQERIIEGKPRKYIVYKKDLYNWWLRKCKDGTEVKVGHRYYCALALVSFATKCNVLYDEVKKDLYSLRELFDSITIEEENHFTKGDIEDALKIYGSDKAHKFKREFVSKQCKIVISKNKRNGRTREEHLKFARASKAFKKMFQEPYDLPDNREQKFKTNTIDLLVSTLYKNKTEKITVEKLYKLTGISTSTINRYKNKIFERYSKNYPNEINPLNSKEQNKNALIELLKINGISILSNKDNLAKELLISKRTLERILKDETVQKIIENQKKIEEVFS